MPEDQMIERILNKTGSFSGALDASHYMRHLASSDSLFEQLSPNEYKYRDYYLLTGIYFLHRKAITTLEELNKISFLKEEGIVPEWIACPLLGDAQRDFLLIERIRGTEKGNVIPYRQAYSSVSREEKERVVRLVGKLMERKFYCKEMLEFGAWFVVPSTGRLVLGHHAEFRSAEEPETQALLVQRLRNLFSI